MAGYIKVETDKLPVQPINTGINKEILTKFKIKCRRHGIPMNIPIEIFMAQYSKGHYTFNREDILKWKEDNEVKETLNTPINKDVYYQFKKTVKDNGYFLRHVVSAFIEDYAENDLTMEFVERKSKFDL